MDMLCSHNYENIEKKALQYSRKEMEDLRFVNLEEQKKKWLEIYCGLEEIVAEGYDLLVKLGNTNRRPKNKALSSDPPFQSWSSRNVGGASVSTINREIACANVQEDHDGASKSDEDSGPSKVAFLVIGDPDFDAGPPQDGLEYLRRVRWEAARIPKVVNVGNVDQTKEQSSYMPQIPDIIKCPEHLSPLKEWEEAFLMDFSELKQAISELAETADTISCAEEEEEEEEEDDDSDPCADDVELEGSSSHSPKSTSYADDVPPTLSRLLKMSSRARAAMLKGRVRRIENLQVMSHDEGLWLFCLLSTVDLPLDADAAAAIRSLLRKCASMRASKAGVDDEAVVLDILMAISGRYFGQQDK